MKVENSICAVSLLITTLALMVACNQPLAGPDTLTAQEPVLAIDTTLMPDGVRLLCSTADIARDRALTGNVVVVGNSRAHPGTAGIVVRSVLSSDLSQSHLHAYDLSTLGAQSELVFAPEIGNGLWDRASLDVVNHTIHVGAKNASSAVEYSDGKLSTRWIKGGSSNPLGRSIHLGNVNGGTSAYSRRAVDSAHVALERTDMATGERTTVHVHESIDLKWDDGLSGFTRVTEAGGAGRDYLVYFVRSYSRALGDPTFRLCAYDLRADTLAYEYTPAELGLREDQSTSIWPQSVLGDRMVLLTGHQYVGFDPFAAKVLWVHDEVDGVRIFANSGTFVPSPSGVVAITSNGAAPMAGFDVATGAVLWVNDEPRRNGPMSHPVGDAHIAYVGIDGRLYLLEALTGRIVWKMRSPLTVDGRDGVSFAGRFAVVGDVIYVRDRYRVYALEVEL